MLDIYAAIYRYLLHNQAQLIPLTKMYLYGKSVNDQILDLDLAELNLSDQYTKGTITMDFDLLQNFDDRSCNPNL